MQALEHRSILIQQDGDRCVQQARQQNGVKADTLSGEIKTRDSAQEQQILDQRSRAIAECRADQDAALSRATAQERVEYLCAARVEKGGASLMTTLTSSLRR